MDNTIIVTIPDELRNTIQRADIEQSARKNIILYILSHDDIKVSEERFNRYQREYEEKLFLFESSKQQLEQDYIMPILNNKKYTWSLDYNTCKVTITILE